VEEMSDRVQTLDLRPLLPYERHEKIFKAWDGLQTGETLRIINDHNPKPLYYHFEAEQKGKFQWEFEQEGPKDWIFKIKRV
jgi:uncharacterized protein (DUF2249 family)